MEESVVPNAGEKLVLLFGHCDGPNAKPPGLFEEVISLPWILVIVHPAAFVNQYFTITPATTAGTTNNINTPTVLQDLKENDLRKTSPGFLRFRVARQKSVILWIIRLLTYGYIIVDA